jgi:DNA modification methylase
MNIEHYSIVLARKPLSEKSVAENVLKHGTGGINIDGSRIGTTDKYSYPNGAGGNGFHGGVGREPDGSRTDTPEMNDLGRFPANIIFDEEAGQLLDEQSGYSKGTSNVRKNKIPQSIYGNGKGIPPQESKGFSDKGGASRFFYCPKEEDETNEIKKNNMNIELKLGDCLEVLKTIPDNSIDSVVTDPPYGLSFMGKKWDYDVPSVEIWEECLRVLKPGGHLLSFAGSRTYHRMAVRIEDAGFEIRDQIMWVYGSGFPKSHNIGKAIDKIEGNEREDLGANPNARPNFEGEQPTTMGGKHKWNNLTKGNSEWEGWGTALKPAHEPIVMARKPLSEKSIAENVLKHGTGGINIDGSRIEMKDKENINFDRPRIRKQNENWIISGKGYDYENENCKEYNEQGRFPANIIFDEEAGQLLDEQSDKASRFFYCPKSSKKDRNEGLDEFEAKPVQAYEFAKSNSFTTTNTKSGTQNRFPSQNNHPTVKPTDLMRYLINLITPANGTVLDPFMGSGSTGKAAVRCGVNFVGIEKEEEYMEIAKARIEHEKNKPVQQKLYL